jgi:hypothetical protein
MHRNSSALAPDHPPLDVADTTVLETPAQPAAEESDGSVQGGGSAVHTSGEHASLLAAQTVPLREHCHKHTLSHLVLDSAELWAKRSWSARRTQVAPVTPPVLTPASRPCTPVAGTSSAPSGTPGAAPDAKMFRDSTIEKCSAGHVGAAGNSCQKRTHPGSTNVSVCSVGRGRAMGGMTGAQQQLDWEMLCFVQYMFPTGRVFTFSDGSCIHVDLDTVL